MTGLEQRVKQGTSRPCTYPALIKKVLSPSTKQVQTWLAMEAHFEELQGEAAAARADAQARGSELASLSAARDEQLAQVGFNTGQLKPDLRFKP